VTTNQAPAAIRLRRLDLRAVDRDPAIAVERRALCRRGAVPDPAVRDAVRRILADVHERGAKAVMEANRRFGGGLVDGRLTLERGEIRQATDTVPPALRVAIEAAIANVRAVARAGLPRSTTTEPTPGVHIERRWLPLSRVGAYVPGGTAPLPSSLLMTVVPAQVAGVDSILVATPATSDGMPDPTTLAAAGILGVERVLAAGGAQAIGALAFGLPELDVEPVERIVGPGSVWVTAAKLEVMGLVGIDLPAGPSEGLVLATPPADPDRVAADLLTQAEHGPDSPAILVTTDAGFAAEIELAVARRLERAARADILARALGDHGRIVLALDLDAAIAFVNDYAPEHLSVDLPEADLEPAVARLRNAGSLFVGPWAPESAGDYATGANHVLPTGGLARSENPLSVESFGRYTQVQRLTHDGLAALRPTIKALAEAEGLLAHRDAVEARFADDPEVQP
jgi:histidinol dehydrogenase